MSSGISVAENCVLRYNELKLRHTMRYIIYRLSDDLSEIIVDKEADKTAKFDDFLIEAKKVKDRGECRYAVYDVPFEHGGLVKNKLLFILWAPEDAKVKQKMVYAASKDAIKRKLEGLAKELQATELSDLEWEHVVEVCSS
jgi:hypothetical protein